MCYTNSENKKLNILNIPSGSGEIPNRRWWSGKLLSPWPVRLYNQAVDLVKLWDRQLKSGWEKEF